MAGMNELALRAREDRPFLEEFIGAQLPFIRRAAARQAGRFVSESDDEYAVALSAFYEAVQRFRPNNGAFVSFAELLIGSRLKDFFRREKRFAAETAVAPQAFDGAIEPDAADAALQAAVAQQAAAAKPQSAAAEIAQANTALQAYGFGFYDIAAASPKSEKTKAACVRAAVTLLQHEELLQAMTKTRSLPLQALAAQSGVDRKTLERHRRYLIAAAVLLCGDYPMLAEYLRPIRKELAQCVG